MGLNNLPEDTNLSVLISRLEDRIERMERATRIMPASISNAQLVGLVKPQAIYDFLWGFALLVAGSTIRTTTITVPAGMTSAVVSVISRLYANNPLGVTDVFNSLVQIASVRGNALNTLVSAGGNNINVCTVSTVLTGLTPGSSFDVVVASACGAMSGSNWAYNANNMLDISGTVIWLR